MMVEEGDEVRDSALEVDVVFPERVVGVDEQILAGRRALGMGRHREMIRQATSNQ